ncbi:FkbM family methyltransferase [Pseudooceanicola nanhaiensis]|uniref:FkbM family methyltransferase n=1 Tax=Pseudooceanicola nanhaiensis TaxID=375761 RepID=UPI001CD35496|nr:FkbM family methyltransferase [Pseudooceanicola nanhaiensis]MCA0922605.1 FkbM family methyltransferase [Pseudooceanicola nanhaiensis]
MRCAIITPVGPGHMDLLEQSCTPSIRRAMAYDMGPFSEVRHLVMDDTLGQHGRSNRRNDALAEAVAEGIDWVYFLDADDVLTPNAFEAFGRIIAAEPGLDAVWGLICEFDEAGQPQLREGQPERLDTRAEFLAVPPYLSIQIGAFIRADAAAQIGFDATMDTGEDFKFYYALWAGYSCAKRPEIFFVNRRGQHSTGPRSATGADWRRVVDGLWAAQLAEVPVWTEVRDPKGEGSARMRITNPNDLIQMAHLRGEFFEADSLDKLRRLVAAPNPRIVEVGANIGNHVVWYAKHLGAQKIYPVEPNPVALNILQSNIDANDLGGVIDTRGMGFGAGASEGHFTIQTDNADNLGATRLVPTDEGGVETRTLDALMGEEKVDFIKIDAEGMEMEVLEGAAALIARDKPLIWVEVLRPNMMRFAQNWCRQAGYRVVDSTPYRNTIDYFAAPKE